LATTDDALPAGERAAPPPLSMGESLLTALSMDTATAHHPHQGPSTFLSMDTSSHDDFDLFLPPPGPFQRCLHAAAAAPPDINLPLAADPSPPPPALYESNVDMLDVGLGCPQLYDSDSPAAAPVPSAPVSTTTTVHVSHTKSSGSSAARKCVKRNDSIWGAWFFFTHYFKPVMSADKGVKTKAATAAGNGGNNATMDAFLVQHDMENMYMWVFKERPENALGKMQLRSFMNGHSRLGEPQFPFSAEKGFVRSHRMQRKHYRGLSNPQCLHGIEIVQTPNLVGVPEADLIGGSTSLGGMPISLSPLRRVILSHGGICPSPNLSSTGLQRLLQQRAPQTRSYSMVLALTCQHMHPSMVLGMVWTSQLCATNAGRIPPPLPWRRIAAIQIQTRFKTWMLHATVLSHHG